MSTLPPLAARLAELQAALAAAQQRANTGALPAPEREGLKEEIIALYKQVDAAVSEAQALKEQVKALAGEWKHLAPRGESTTGAATVAPAGGAAGGPARVDHLGASTFIEKGWSKLSLGDAVGAEATLRKALQLAPGSNEAETLLGWALLEQEQLDAATQHLHAVLLRDSQHALARATLGAVCVRRGDGDAAVDHLGQAIRSDRDRKATLYAHLYLGQLYRGRAMYDDAERFFHKALELGPNLLQAWYELGWTYWLAGRTGDAVAAWRTGAEANKFSPWGKRCAEVIVDVEQGGAPSLR
jgi:tetratricopeptide (TPR) repeat protein